MYRFNCREDVLIKLYAVLISQNLLIKVRCSNINHIFANKCSNYSNKPNRCSNIPRNSSNISQNLSNKIPHRFPSNLKNNAITKKAHTYPRFSNKSRRCSNIRPNSSNMQPNFSNINPYRFKATNKTTLSPRDFLINPTDV